MTLLQKTLIALPYAEAAINAYHKRCSILRKASVLGQINGLDYTVTRWAVDAALDRRVKQINANFGTDIKL